jgi:V/A-type H+/Na+-transporting ATPase subunit D
MAGKIKLTRPELKQQKDLLARYKRYLPTLKLKQLLLQVGVLSARHKLREAQSAVEQMDEKVQAYGSILKDDPGVPIHSLVKPTEVKTTWSNVAGVKIPTFQEAIFPDEVYSLFSTPPWVDRAIEDLQELNTRKERSILAELEVTLLKKELTKIVQRINLFEKVMIPRAKDAIRKISIYLADEQTAGVVRAKITKAKQKEKAAIQRGLEAGEEVAP